MREDLAYVLLHGRGSGPMSMRALAERLGTGGAEVRTPAAPGGSWYPQRFVVPREANQPQLGTAIEVAEQALADLDPARTVLGGFSQGACLACEVLARRPRRLAALLVFSGGLIGADEELTRPPAGSLDGVPALLTVIRGDGWIPVERVERTADVLEAAGASVQVLELEPAEHTVHDAEVTAARTLLSDTG